MWLWSSSRLLKTKSRCWHIVELHVTHEQSSYSDDGLSNRISSNRPSSTRILLLAPNLLAFSFLPTKVSADLKTSEKFRKFTQVMQTLQRFWPLMNLRKNPRRSYGDKWSHFSAGKFTGNSQRFAGTSFHTRDVIARNYSTGQPKVVE